MTLIPRMKPMLCSIVHRCFEIIPELPKLCTAYTLLTLFSEMLAYSDIPMTSLTTYFVLVLN